MKREMIRFLKFNLLVLIFSLVNLAFAAGFQFLHESEYPKWYWGILGMLSATQAMIFDGTREIKEGLRGFQKRTKRESEEENKE